MPTLQTTRDAIQAALTEFDAMAVVVQPQLDSVPALQAQLAQAITDRDAARAQVTNALTKLQADKAADAMADAARDAAIALLGG